MAGELKPGKGMSDLDQKLRDADLLRRRELALDEEDAKLKIDLDSMHNDQNQNLDLSFLDKTEEDLPLSVKNINTHGLEQVTVGSEKNTTHQVDPAVPIDRLPMYMKETEENVDLNIPEQKNLSVAREGLAQAVQRSNDSIAQSDKMLDEALKKVDDLPPVAKAPKTIQDELGEFAQNWGATEENTTTAAEPQPAPPIQESKPIEKAIISPEAQKIAAIAELEKVIAQAKKTIEDNNRRKEILLKKIAELEASPLEKKRARAEKFTNLMIEYAAVLNKMEKAVKKNDRERSKVLVQKILDANTALFSKIASYSDLPQYAMAAKQINARMRAIDEKMGPVARIPTIESARAEIESKRKKEIENLPEIIELKATLQDAVNSTKGKEKNVAQSWLDLFNKSILEFLKAQAEDYKNVKGKEARASEKGFRDQVKKIEKINKKYDQEISKFM